MMKDFKEGDQINSLRIKRLLNKGVFGSVYLASCKNLNMDVAVKVFESGKTAQ